MSSRTYTHNFSAGYGSPEVDQTTPRITRAEVSDDGLSVRIVVEGIQESHIHDFDLDAMRSDGGQALLHSMAYYTVNEIPAVRSRTRVSASEAHNRGAHATRGISRRCRSVLANLSR